MSMYTRYGIVFFLIGMFLFFPGCSGPSGGTDTGDNGSNTTGNTPATTGEDAKPFEPYLVKIADQSLHSGQSYSYPCQLIIGTKPVTWSIDDMMTAQGMKIDSNGVITWTAPTVGGPASVDFTVTVKAANSAGTREKTFKLSVYPGENSPPAIVSASATGTLMAGQEGYVTVSCVVLDAENNVTSVEADLSQLGGGAAQKLELQSGNGYGVEYLWLGKVKPGQAGTMTVAFKASDGGSPVVQNATIEVKANDAANPMPVNVVLDAATLGGTGGVIVYQGREFRGKVAVPNNALVGVIKNGQSYLYHPALGNAEISVDNSRRALGYLFNQISTNPAVAKRLKSIAKETLTQDPIPLNQETLLSTGLTIKASAPTKSFIQNSTKRWAAVKTMTGDGPVFLSPQDQLRGFAWLDSATVTKIVQTLQTLQYGANVIDDSSRNMTGAPVKAYGSVVYGMNLLFEHEYSNLLTNPNVPQRVKDWMKYVHSPYTQDEVATELSKLAAKTVTPLADDPALFFRLNALEYGMFVINAIKSLAGAIPSECVEVIFRSVIGNALQTTWATALTMDPFYFADFATKMGWEMTTAYLQCGAEMATGGTSSVVSNLLDAISFCAWLSDVGGAIDDTRKFSAYDCVDFQSEPADRIIWSFLIGEQRAAYAPATVVNGQVFFVTEYTGSTTTPNCVYCLDAGSGQKAWEYTPSPATNPLIPKSPLVADGKVFVGISHGYKQAYLGCLGAAGGALQWETKVEEMNSAPSYSNGQVYVGGYRKIWCLNAADGKVAWSNYGLIFPWGLETPAVVGDKIYITAGEGTVYCIKYKPNTPQGQEASWIVWQKPAGGGNISSPTLAENKVFVSDSSAGVFCLDAAAGTQAWTLPGMGGGSTHPLLYANGSLFTVSVKKAFKLTSGGSKTWESLEWSSVLGDPAVSDKCVYLVAVPKDGSSARRLFCLDAGTGAVLWDYLPKDGELNGNLVVSGGKVYCGTKLKDPVTSKMMNYFVCIRGQDGDTGDWPMYKYNPARTGGK